MRRLGSAAVLLACFTASCAPAYGGTPRTAPIALAVDNGFKDWRIAGVADRIGDGAKLSDLIKTTLKADGLPVTEGITKEADGSLALAGCRTGLPAIGYSANGISAPAVDRNLFAFLRIHELGHHSKGHVRDCFLGGKFFAGAAEERAADCFAVAHFMEPTPSNTKVLNRAVQFFLKRRATPYNYPADTTRARYITERCLKK